MVKPSGLKDSGKDLKWQFIFLLMSYNDYCSTVNMPENCFWYVKWHLVSLFKKKNEQNTIWYTKKLLNFCFDAWNFE